MLSPEDEPRSGGPEEWWRDLLSSYQPPHDERDWFGPLFWPLLRAASRHEVLRGNYPSTALNSFIVHKDEQAWRAREQDLWPTVVVSSDGFYTIRAAPWSAEAGKLFVSTDPSAVAKRLADLIRVRMNEA